MESTMRYILSNSNLRRCLVKLLDRVNEERFIIDDDMDEIIGYNEECDNMYINFDLFRIVIDCQTHDLFYAYTDMETGIEKTFKTFPELFEYKNEKKKKLQQ